MTTIITDTQTVALLVPGAPFKNLPFPQCTPWGKAQHTDIIMWAVDDTGQPVPVLWQVHTAGHGGTRVHRDLAARFLNGLPKACHSYGGSRLWYEEDSESCVPLFIFYNGLSSDCWLVRGEARHLREKLLETVRRSLPETTWAVRILAERFDAALTTAGITLRSPL